MMRLSFGKILSSLVVAAALAGMGPSCSSGVGGTDSNTHWLDQCLTDADCAGLSCICGLCTARCTNADSCAGLENAECASVSCTSSPQPVCVATCSGDAACTAIQPGLSCESGRCGYSSGGSGGTDAGAPADGAVPDGNLSSGGSGGGGLGQAALGEQQRSALRRMRCPTETHAR